METINMQNISNSAKEHSAKEPIGKYGRMREEYLMLHKPDLYLQLLNSGRLDKHLKKVDDEACRILDALLARTAKKKEVREMLKNTNKEERAEFLRRIHDTAEEAMLEKLVYG